MKLDQMLKKEPELPEIIYILEQIPGEEEC